MAANSKIQDFQTMINGLQTYMSSLQEHSQTLKQAAETYNSGINDRSSNVYIKKIDKLCGQIDPITIEKIDKLKKNLQAQMEQLIEMERQLDAEENE